MNKTIDEASMELINYNIGVIFGMSFLKDDKEGTLNECAYTTMTAIGEENIDMEVIKKAIKETVAKHIKNYGLDEICDRLVKDYKLKV